MKKTSKLLSALLALVMVISLFAACGNDSNKEEETTTDGFTVQANDNMVEATDEETTEAEVTTKVENTTKPEKTTKVKNTVKVEKTTKTKETTKPEKTTKVNDKNEGNSNSATTKPAVTEKEELKVANIDLLLGTWIGTVVDEGVAIDLNFEFGINGKLRTYFTKDSYEKMIQNIIDAEMSGVTEEEITGSGEFTSKKELEEYLYEVLTQELPYNELSSMFNQTGNWNLHGDTLSVTIEGETLTAETKLSENVKTFVLDPNGDPIKFRKI